MDYTIVIAIIPVILVIAYIVWIAKRMADGDRVDMKEGIMGIVILMVAMLVLASFSSPYEEREYDFEYLDVVPASALGSPSAVTGAGQLIEIDGASFVRFTDVGEVNADGRTYSVGPAKLDFILTAGQSNSAYYTDPSLYPSDSPIAPGKAFYLGFEQPDHANLMAGTATRSNVNNAGIVDFAADDGSTRIASYYPNLASDYYEESGHRMLVVVTGIGGMSIVRWDSGQECDLFIKALLKRVGEVCDRAHFSLMPKVVLWIQGESDSQKSVSFYLEHFEPLLKRFASGYGYRFPAVIASLPRSSLAPPLSQMPPALAQIAASEDTASLTISSSLVFHFGPAQMRDSVHYSQSGYDMIGEAFARQIAKVYGYEPVDETIAIAETVGTVTELPTTVTAYGTSGEAFELRAAWTETSTAGTYSASLSGNPAGTQIAPGLTPIAVLSS